MSKKIEVPKINQVIVQYNGYEKAFDSFMESMINEFLNSCSIANTEQDDFIDNVENSKKSLNRWTCRALCGSVCCNAGTTQRTCQRRMIK